MAEPDTPQDRFFSEDMNWTFASGKQFRINDVPFGGSSALSGLAPSLVANTGEYWGTPAAKSTGVLAAGNIYTMAVFVPKDCTVDRIGAEVTTLAAGSTISLGIYNDDGNGNPGPLLLDAGTIDGGTASAQEKTINLSLPGGKLYHFAALCQGGAPTVRTVTGCWQGANSSLTAAAGSATRSGRSKSGQVGTALPNPMGTIAVSSAVVSVAVRLV